MSGEDRVNVPALVSSGIVLGGILVLVAVVYGSFTVIQPGNVGVVFNRWSGALKTVGQGVAWRIPWVTQVQSYPVALRTYTMVRRSAEGTVQGDDSLDLPTKEGQHIRQDISVTYNTSQEKAADVFRSFRGAEIGDIEGTFIRRTIITTAQNAAGQMSLTDLISNQRGQLQEQIQDNLQHEMNKIRGRQGEPRREPPARRDRAANAAEDGGSAAGPAGGVRAAAPADAGEGQGRRGRGRRAGDAREGQGAGRGQQAPAGGAHAPAHPEQGDRALERHAPAVHWRRGGPLSQPEGPGRREWRGALYSPGALRYVKLAEEEAAGLRGRTTSPSPGRSAAAYRARGVFGTDPSREWSAIRNVARVTVTPLWQRGHCGSILLPATPSRYESGAWQCGQGSNRACAMGVLSSSGSADDQLFAAPDAEHRALAP